MDGGGTHRAQKEGSHHKMFSAQLTDTVQTVVGFTCICLATDFS